MPRNEREREREREPEVPVLTDRDRALDLLALQKHLCLAYMIAERECANEGLRQALHRLHAGPEESHARLFQIMHERDWYQTPVAGQQAIESAIIRWEQYQLREQTH